MSAPGRVTVSPETFSLVSFDASRIADLASDIAARAGLGGVDIEIVVDETSPFARFELVTTDPVRIEVESAALEHPQRLRALGDQQVIEVLTRAFFRAADRRDPAFGTPPAEADVRIEEIDVWDARSVGRAARTGLEFHRPRWLYRFRNRHGFTDVADAVFDRAWSGEIATWDAIVAACAETAEARPPRREKLPRADRAGKR